MEYVISLLEKDKALLEKCLDEWESKEYTIAKKEREDKLIKINKAINILKIKNILQIESYENIEKELFAKLTDEERMEIFSDYCEYCGQNEKENGKCYCAPCYDK